MNLHQWKNTIKNFNDKFSENKEVQKEWNINTKANLPLFKKENSIWNLDFKYSGKDEKAFFLVGSSPALKKDVLLLKDVNRDNSRILCCNSSLKFLLRHDVKPDYVISLDSDKIDIPQHLDIDRDDITLLASSATHRSVLDKWKGPIYYLPYYSLDDELKPKIRAKLGRKVPSGGNSMTEALFVATVIFGAKVIVFVGTEYCFDKDYYADKTAAKQEKLKTLYPAVDVLGNKRWTLPALYQYAIWTEKACGDLTPPAVFIDTSFGLLGKDTDIIYNKTLEDTLRLVDEIFKGKKDGLQIAELRVRKHDRDKGEVLRYDLSAQRDKLLQFARGRS